ALHVFTSFRALLLARVISGVATSLLFSAFEAWMVAEHSKRFASRKLAETFAMQTQGNALAAVVAGMVAQAAVAVGGYGAPMVVAVPLLSYAALEISKWPENVGCKRAGLVDVAFGRGYHGLGRGQSRSPSVPLRGLNAHLCFPVDALPAKGQRRPGNSEWNRVFSLHGVHDAGWTPSVAFVQMAALAWRDIPPGSCMLADA
ncbi:unnamed protein product, partial [Polarella glacialis]